jgi:hypothetical protein
MHKENGRSFAVVTKMSGDVVKLDALMLLIIKV